MIPKPNEIARKRHVGALTSAFGFQVSRGPVLSLQERLLERTQLAAVDLLEGGGAGHVAMRCVCLNELTKGRVLCLRERSDHLGGKGGCGKGGG